jgi:hypothetical protein
MVVIDARHRFGKQYSPHEPRWSPLCDCRACREYWDARKASGRMPPPHETPWADFEGQVLTPDRSDPGGDLFPRSSPSRPKVPSRASANYLATYEILPQPPHGLCPSRLPLSSLELPV